MPESRSGYCRGKGVAAKGDTQGRTFACVGSRARSCCLCELSKAEDAPLGFDVARRCVRRSRRRRWIGLSQSRYRCWASASARWSAVDIRSRCASSSERQGDGNPGPFCAVGGHPPGRKIENVTESTSVEIGTHAPGCQSERAHLAHSRCARDVPGRACAKAASCRFLEGR